MDNWLLGMEIVFQWYNIWLIFIGVLIGLSFASLPGLNNITAMILMIPFVYDMAPIPALIFMTAVYGGGIHGGCILAILFRIPGEAQSAVTVFDGAPMADQGRGALAMGIAFLYSSFGGLFGALVCITFAPLLSRFVLFFGPPEFFSFIFFGLIVASSVGSDSILKGITAAMLGCLLATVGVAPGSGVMRYTFDTHILQMGLAYIPIIMGVFAVAELIQMVRDAKAKEGAFIAPKWMVELPSLAFIWNSMRTFFRSALAGTFIGFLPGAGATAASFVAYGLEVRNSKHPERYGKGEPLGVVAAETANNASYGGAFIPMLTMGIPGSSGTAVILAILLLKGVQPSASVFSKMPDMVYSLFVTLILVNIVMFVQSIVFGRLYLNMLKFPKGILCFIILIFCTVGTFSVRSSIEDVWVMMIFGGIGYVMNKTGFPVASLILGIILGPMAETTFIQSVDSVGKLSPVVFFSSPISAALMSLGIFLLVWPMVKAWRKQRVSLFTPHAL